MMPYRITVTIYLYLYPVAMLLLSKIYATNSYCTNHSHIALTASALQAIALLRIKGLAGPSVRYMGLCKSVLVERKGGSRSKH